MRKALLLLALAAPLCLAPASAQAEFGITDFDVTYTDENGDIDNRAGIHPYEMTTSFKINREKEGELVFIDEAVRDALFTQMEGFAANPAAVPKCSTADFLTASANSPIRPDCRNTAAVGILGAELAAGGGESGFFNVPVYNVAASPGIAGRLGFWVSGVPVVVDALLSEEPPYRIVAGLTNTSQVVEVVGSVLTLWGVPADERHDPLRGTCLRADGSSSGEDCSVKIDEKPFITTPRACLGPLRTSYRALSWEGSVDTGSVLTHDEAGNPDGMGDCSAVDFAPRIEAAPTARAAQSPSGLDFALNVPDEGLTSPDGVAGSDIREAVVTLPEGMSINPSQAEGLGVCSESQLDRESAFSEPGEGCPGASKIGTIEVETPLLEGELLKGALYVAEPYRNLAGDSLIAVYVVIKSPERGINVVQPLRVEPDPATGQLLTYSEDMPQLPFSEFRLRFREGGRSPLITPPGCDGNPSEPGRQPFEVEASFTPWAGGPDYKTSSSFEIVSGPNGSPCPTGKAPFEPGFEAGTTNNAAGAHSPFFMRITRGDGMQDLTKFSAVLPPGVVGKIAGIPWCPEAGIARAKSRTGESGGRDELRDPSCPAASQVGRTVGGAGVGSQLTYVGGSLYLAGPYKGAPLSVVSITPAVAGPFDAGVVVVRVGLDLNPISGVVEADGSRSDPIPHILKGIPLNVRDLRVYTDRPEFTLNATSCEESNTLATLWGAGTVLDPSFETPVARAARYQAAGCASLGFSPKLGIKLKGGAKRGKFPALRAHYRPQAGDANLRRLALTFPASAFIEQGHFRTICTRVQFAAGPGHGALCPKGSVYGTARVWTPLLDEPLSGPVILRSSDHNLPDAVFALHGPPSAAIEIEVMVRIDSVNGRLRATVESAPDAPVSRAIVDMQGGQKGLFVNSRNLCHKAGRNRARANLRGQNGRLSRTNPRVVALACAKRRKAKRSSHRRRARIARASQAR
jgi:hypothetical protein